MAMDLIESTAHGVENSNSTLYMLGGVALIVFGAGLVLSHPGIRRYMSNIGVGNLATAVIPDVERYFKLRSM